MKLTRKWLLVMALVLSVAMATTGTLAYLTDRDSEANVFTMGNVDIDLNEDFEQGAELIPGVDIEKKPTIKNTGKNDAWVWATIAIPSALDKDNASENVVHFNYDKETVGEGKWTWQDTEGNWLVQKEVEHTEEDGTVVKYNVYTVLYQSVLKPGDETPAVMTKVYMDDHIDIDPEGNLHHVLAGNVTDIDWNIKDDGNPVIYVSAYAMQAEGFDTVLEAWEAYNAQWDKDSTTVTADDYEWGKLPNLDEDDSNDGKTVVPVTPENIESLDLTTITEDTLVQLSGDFSGVEGLIKLPEKTSADIIIDGTNATFEGGVLIDAGVAHAYSSLSAERTGTITIRNFDVPQELNVNAYNKESVVIENNKAGAISVIGGNFALTIDGNTIDGNFGRYTDGEDKTNEYGISLRICDYELSITDNTITDVYSHVIGLNGRQGETASDWIPAGTNNKITAFSGNNINVNTTFKSERAALKIWCDKVYAPYATSGAEPTAAAKALMSDILADTSNVFTLGTGHTIFNIFDYKTNGN